MLWQWWNDFDHAKGGLFWNWKPGAVGQSDKSARPPLPLPTSWTNIAFRVRTQRVPDTRPLPDVFFISNLTGFSCDNHRLSDYLKCQVSLDVSGIPDQPLYSTKKNRYSSFGRKNYAKNTYFATFANSRQTFDLLFYCSDHWSKQIYRPKMIVWWPMLYSSQMILLNWQPYVFLLSNRA